MHNRALTVSTNIYQRFTFDLHNFGVPRLRGTVALRCSYNVLFLFCLVKLNLALMNLDFWGVLRCSIALSGGTTRDSSEVYAPPLHPNRPSLPSQQQLQVVSQVKLNLSAKSRDFFSEKIQLWVPNKRVNDIQIKPFYRRFNQIVNSLTVKNPRLNQHINCLYTHRSCNGHD